MTKKILSKADFYSAVVCLRGESLSKGALFTLSIFMKRHGLDNSFRRIITKHNLFDITLNKWILEDKISDELINKLYEFLKNDEQDYKIEMEKRKNSRYYNDIKETLKNKKIKKDDIYISVQSFNENYPNDLLAKGIGMGNGIFFINIKHIEDYERTNAGDKLSPENRK